MELTEFMEKYAEVLKEGEFKELGADLHALADRRAAKEADRERRQRAKSARRHRVRHLEKVEN